MTDPPWYPTVPAVQVVQSWCVAVSTTRLENWRRQLVRRGGADGDLVLAPMLAARGDARVGERGCRSDCRARTGTAPRRVVGYKRQHSAHCTGLGLSRVPRGSVQVPRRAAGCTRQSGRWGGPVQLRLVRADRGVQWGDEPIAGPTRRFAPEPADGRCRCLAHADGGRGARWGGNLEIMSWLCRPDRGAERGVPGQGVVSLRRRGDALPAEVTGSCATWATWSAATVSGAWSVVPSR